MESETRFEKECQKCLKNYTAVYDKVDQAEVNGCPRCEGQECAECKKVVDRPEDLMGCACHKYGNSGHEELGWCSVTCMDKDHPDLDYDQDEESEG